MNEKDNNMNEEQFSELVKMLQYNIEIAKSENKCKRSEEALPASDNLNSRLDTLLSPEKDVTEEEVRQIIDFEAIQQLMNYFYKLTRIGMGMIDLKGDILVMTGWQDICSKFHRIHPQTLENCIESDVFLSANVGEGKYSLYKCRNNMWDMATPIIVGGRHIANIFLGQFFFEDETPDYKVFINQAEKYGFNKDEYLAVLEKVPRWSRETVANVMEFYTRFAGMIAKLSYSNTQLTRSLVEQKRGEVVLRRSEERLNLCMEATNDGLWDWDIKTDGEYFSPGCYHILGYEVSDFPIKGSVWSDLMHPDDRENALRAKMDCIEGRNEKFEVEYRMKAKNGEWRWILGRGKCVARDERGYAIRLVGTHVDVTERKRMEKALQEKEEQYRGFFSTSKDCVFITSKDGRLIDLNDAAVELFGYSSREELLHVKIPYVYANQEERAKHARIIKESGYAREYPVDLRRKDGSIRHALITAVARYNADGKTIGFQGTIRDITERRRVEDELKKYHEKLEFMVAERTNELESKTKNLREINTALNVLLRKREDDRKIMEERFIANIGSLVIPYVEKIRKNNLDAQQQLCLDIIEKNLDEIVTPLLKNIQQFNFTPREIQIASLIKDGKTTKEIAETLGIGKGSIDTHRKNIRKKIGLDRSSNLQSQLRFLEK